ncbi:VOC family protein [Paracoccus sp. (in: a-proteobacteria)]|uniref:VOC family protein n=1 Tax=Paracoccus sp. TaxID=267 RepID=UPI00396CC4FA
MPQAYVEHVALFVSDFQPHLAFFREVLGMDVNRTAGPEENPRSIWLEGGIQLLLWPEQEGVEGRLAHLGIMVEDLPEAIERARAAGARSLPAGNNWLSLPDGLQIELMQAQNGAVSAARAIRPR